MKGDLKNTTQVFKALSLEKRLRILNYLMKHKEPSLAEISQDLRIPFMTASRNLIILVNAGFIDRVPVGNSVKFRISAQGLIGKKEAILLAFVKSAFEKDDSKRRNPDKSFVNIWLSGNYKKLMEYIIEKG